MRKPVFALVFLFPLIASWGPFTLAGGGTPAPPCEGLCRTFLDNFDDGDIDGWVQPDVDQTVGASCVIRPDTPDAIAGDTAICNYDGVGDGNNGPQPDSFDQWGAAIFRDTTNDQNGGIALRRKPAADMSGTEFYYAARIGASNIDVRACDGETADPGFNETDCTTFETGSHGEGTITANDALIFAVVGEDADREWAFWYVNAEDETFDPCSPSTWNQADFCTYPSGGAIDNAKFTANVLAGGTLPICGCGGATSCTAWTSTPVGDPTDTSWTDVSYYVGSTSSIDATTVCGGTI